MIVDTRGLKTEEVLTALYKHALVVHNPQPARYAKQSQADSDEEGLFVRAICNGHTLPTEFFAAHVIRETPDLIFGAKVMLDEGAVDLNVNLSNPNEFDATAYDSLYYVGAASEAIRNLRIKKTKQLKVETNREQESEQLPQEPTGAGNGPLTHNNPASAKSPTSGSPTARWEYFRTRVGSMLSTVSSCSSPTFVGSLSTSTDGSQSPTKRPSKLEI